ncbi:signal recognition particle-docking protein FtsY [Actinoalloteichus hymeniacidonis]|uniref:Signal recognition particle receptor FtsY n=1 Tax=Actinoalloteichus hymeniacidonis TaxID=340345 RepID=A0AAC9HTE8_9PSEU|nr:signal recognition particle-docking protein FtsY [Actinoalloteichus hymeniacidonis]AOS65239.1 signal recognition particle-docking protein FtsY [Actinoalloteichus hymeniacidonis]MBB5906680.1 fused signal recognition particle receptor [Actinoalloteichus hymeniacidonis]
MSTTLIWVLVIALVVLAAALITGVALVRRRRIRLSDAEAEKPTEQLRPAQRGGGYQAGGGFNLSATTAAPPVERTEVDGQPGVGDDASVPRDSHRQGIVDVTLPAGDVAAPTEQAAPEQAAPEQAAPEQAAPEQAAPEQAAPAPAETEQQTPGTTDTGATTTEPPTTPVPVQPAEPPTTPVPAQPQAAPQAPPAVTTDAASTETVVPTEVEEIAPTEGRLERLRGRLSRSRSAFGQGLLGLLGAGDLDEDSWTDVEDTLLLADLGALTTSEVVGKLRERIASRGVRTAGQVRELLTEVLVEALHPEMERSVRALPHSGRPAVVLVVGVNGTGKTTTTGKLARVLVADGRHVLLGAADTFRAAAAEQLVTWGTRVGAEVVRGREGADPASVAFDAVKQGTTLGADAVLVDTAGRLHTKAGLMDELGKVKRVVEKQAEVDEVLLVLDATTGQNGLTQARVFSEVVDVTGIVLTKLDGTAKGGIVFQVQRELGVPVKLVGLGEGPDDLAPFEPAAFVNALLY